MPTMDTFTFDGKSSSDFHCYVVWNEIDSGPEAQYETAAIPGRSGDFILFGRRYGNVEHSYDVIFTENAEANLAAMREYLMSRQGYCVLSDTRHTSEFYHAYYTGPIVPTITPRRDMAKFTVTFSRKPQRWLVAGETEVTLVNGGRDPVNTIENPTSFYAAPLFRIVGASKSNGYGVSWRTNGFAMRAVTSNDNPDMATVRQSEMIVDCASMQAYLTSGKIACNHYMTYTINDNSAKAMRLAPGNNMLTLSYSRYGDIDIFMKPRWFSL